MPVTVCPGGLCQHLPQNNMPGGRIDSGPAGSTTTRGAQPMDPATPSRSSARSSARSPAGSPGVDRRDDHDAEIQPVALATGLYLLWAAVAAFASVLGAAPLSSLAGAILSIGIGLTISLFWLVDRLPTAEKPSDAALLGALSLMGIIWTTLYLWFVPASGAGSLLAVGMMACAVALAMMTVSSGVLLRLMVFAGGATAVCLLLKQLVLAYGGDVDEGVVALAVQLPVAVLVTLLVVMYRVAWHLDRASNRLRSSNAQLREQVVVLKHQAEHDALTQSYSRASILDMVAREVSRADRNGDPMCVCLLDIDHFKDMNDRYGHQTGDRLLAAFAQRVRGALRRMDTLNSAGHPVPLDDDPEAQFGGMADLVGLANRSAAVRTSAMMTAMGRIGGEEFIILLPGTSMRGALPCAERVRKAVVRRPFAGLHQVTVSIGIAEYRPGETVEDLIGRADQALYAAKNAGRNRVHCATADGGPSAIIMPDLRNGAGLS